MSRLLLTPLALAAALVASAAQADPNDILPEAPGKTLVVRACTACHQAQIVVAQKRTPEEWDTVIATMVGRGAILTEAEQDQVYAYLAKHFAPPAPPPKPSH